MPIVTIVVGVALVALGLVGFYGTGATHYTALIPAGFGAVFFLLGLVALKASLRKHVMHAAAILGLLGCCVHRQGTGESAGAVGGRRRRAAGGGDCEIGDGRAVWRVFRALRGVVRGRPALPQDGIAALTQSQPPHPRPLSRKGRGELC